jgi:hypothetical protein
VTQVHLLKADESPRSRRTDNALVQSFGELHITMASRYVCLFSIGKCAFPPMKSMGCDKGVARHYGSQLSLSLPSLGMPGAHDNLQNNRQMQRHGIGGLSQQ